MVWNEGEGPEGPSDAPQQMPEQGWRDALCPGREFLLRSAGLRQPSLFPLAWGLLWNDDIWRLLIKQK